MIMWEWIAGVGLVAALVVSAYARHRANERAWAGWRPQWKPCACRGRLPTPTMRPPIRERHTADECTAEEAP